MDRRLNQVIAALAMGTACSGAAPPPKPLPGGPPPEYEPPRAFDLPGAAGKKPADDAPRATPPALPPPTAQQPEVKPQP